MGRRKQDNVERWLEDTDRDWVDKLGPLSDAARQRKHRDAGREIGEIPRVRHRRVRESCRLDLLRFGLVYCMDEYEGMDALLKRPPSQRMMPFIGALEDKILHGGLKHVRWPRGKGKSTWVKIALIWASLFRHQAFSVVIEKTSGQAQVVVDEIWKRIYTSPRLSVDFPEFAVAMADVALTPQRMRSQTYRGRPTYMKQDVGRTSYYKLPTLVGFPNTGAIIAFRGANQALRGINIESRRPTFFFIDDPQDETDAKNPRTVEKIEKNITGAVLGSGDINKTLSAVMASTPIEPDDVSETFASREKHPEWETVTETLVASFGPKALMSEYLKRMSIGEKEANDFYVANRVEIERGVEMMDDGDFDATREVSAYQHALNLLFKHKATSFYAEYQMVPSRSQGVYKISAEKVRSRVSGHPMGVVPPECDQGVLAFVDVNAVAGLRWELCAFGRGRVASVLAYGQYPAEGVRLFPEGLPMSAIPKYLAPAIRTVAQTILAQRLVDSEGNAVRCRGVCFDGGWMTECVAVTIADLNAITPGSPFVWSKGFATKEYSRWQHEKAASGSVEGVKAAEECHTWATANGTYLAFNSDYWKEVSQTSFLADPLTPSSSSLYGDDPLVHVEFAQEVCNEELVAKDRSTKYGTVYTWRKDKGRPNHYGDVHAGALVFGAIRGNFDRIAATASAESIATAAKRRRVKYRYKA